MKRIWILSALLAFFSCSPLTQDGGEEGVLSLSFNLADGTKAAMTDEQLQSSAVVSIYKADFSGLVRRYVYSDIPETIYLPADSYRVDVEAGELVKPSPAPASWEQKSYSGSAAFTVLPGKVSNVQVTAAVADVVANVTFDPTVAENMAEGYTFAVWMEDAGTDGQIIYDASKSGLDAYLLPAGDSKVLCWSFSGTRSKNGAPVQKSGTVEGVETGRRYKITPKYTVTDGDLSLVVVVDYSVDIVDDMVVFEPVSTGLSKSAGHEIWAGHATVHADVDENEYSDPSAISFAYSIDGSSWDYQPAVRMSAGVYQAVLPNLQSSTAYTCRLSIAGTFVGEPATFTTEDAPQLPNSDFEVVSNAESSSFKSFYDPASAEVPLQTKFWDSGNVASAGFGYVICESSTDVPDGIGSTRSAALRSRYAVVKFAAGNLFTGEFAGLDGMNGKVNFGRPWTARPTGIRFWWKYNGGKVNRAPSGSPVTTADYDIASIKVALGTWGYKTYGGSKNSPVQVNTGDKTTFWDYTVLPETIAYAEYEETGTGEAGEWTHVTLPLTYSSLTQYPTHIVISAASSKYGDYFAGCDSSVLFIDRIELIYE